MTSLSISAEERIERQTHVEESLASVRLEGLEPSPSALRIFQRYSEGEISLAEMSEEIRNSNAREFGFVLSIRGLMSYEISSS